MKAEELTSVPGTALAEALPGNRVRCKACQRCCLLEEGRLGFCGVRKNQGGKLVPLSYGRVAAVHLANVERKPLFHFFPGEIMLSLGSLGCNFRCPGCQNRELAHAKVPEELSSVKLVPPEALVDQSLKQKLLGISFTYNEPAIWFEYTLDTFKLAKSKGLMTNYVTNGSLTAEAFDEIGPYLDAYRVDIKGFSKETYGSVANFPSFQGVLDVAATAKTKWGMHVECVTNVIPTMSDDRNELRGIAKWIADRLGRDVPWHVTRFVPHGDLGHLRPTPLTTLEQARATGLEEGLRFVYLGNVPGHLAENTYCPECGRILVRRTGLGLPDVMLERGACPDCGYQLPGRFR
jgi:pyruvate formate lyase activating enzyme